MRALLGARDDRHLEQILTNNLREAFRLHTKEPWHDLEDFERSRVLAQLDLALEGLRAASNRMEESPPADFADDRHWPGEALACGDIVSMAAGLGMAPRGGEGDGSA